MHPNFIALVICVGLVLALFSGELFRILCRKSCIGKGLANARGMRAAGSDGLWREKTPSPATPYASNAGWTSHFDRQEWQELDKR